MNKNTTAYEMMKWVKKLFIYYMFDDLASNFYFTGVELDTSFREEFFFGPNFDTSASEVCIPILLKPI